MSTTENRPVVPAPIGALLSRFPAWGYAYLALIGLGVTAIFCLPWSIAERANIYGGPMIVLAALGFVLRDCAVFMAMGLVGSTAR